MGDEVVIGWVGDRGKWGSRFQQKDLVKFEKKLV